MTWLFVLLATLCLVPSGSAAWADKPPALTIAWDPSSLVLIRDRAGYGRIVQLAGDRLLAVYSRGGQIEQAVSANDGKTWTDHKTLSKYAFGHATNAEATRLSDGTLLLAYNERPRDGVHRFAIVTCASTDNGETWSPPQTRYQAGTEFGDGCWEPVFCELPDGSVHLYFANEGPYTDSSEQEITLMRSLDRGKSWAKPERVSFAPGHRDGMPVPLVTRGGKSLLLAIEDNSQTKHFHPAILRTGTATPWPGTQPNRHSPLNLPADSYGGAPYLCQSRRGPLVLACQYNPKPSKENMLRDAYAVVALGDPDTLAFGPITEPLADFGNPSSLWNSVFAHRDGSVTLVTSTRIDGVRGVYAIRGRIVKAD